MKKNKKMIGIVVGVIVLLGIIGAVFALRTPKEEPVVEEKPKKSRISEPTNIIPVEERPYLKIMPLADGRNVEIVVESLKKPATDVDYELEYQAGSLLQGAFGAINIASLPAKTKILFGSCSAGGACTYHEDVQGGNLLTRFSGADETYALKSDWRYFDNKAKETEFSSKDAKFQITSPALANVRYLVIFNTAGYPEGLKGDVLSEPYSLTASSNLAGKATLTMRANEEGELKIAGWDGKTWQEFEGVVDGKMIEAEVELMELYVVVK